MPGRIALIVAPDFLRHAVARVDHGLVFVSGSNGKSTTTNMLTGILRAHGLEVFTNPSGGNLPQGIASALLATVPLDGRVRADIGVIEVDEAYGVALARALGPRAVLLLNVQIDQLNRFFEPSRVAVMLRAVAESTTEFVVVNADDEHLAALGASLSASRTVTAFGVAPALVRAAPHGLANAALFAGEPGAGAGDDGPDAASSLTRTVEVTELEDRSATIAVLGSAPISAALPARGLHYAVDAAAAVATARAVLGDRLDRAKTQSGLASVRTVYGRGEVLEHGGESIELIMMKNPPSMQLNLDALVETPEQLFVAVDEGTPDPSWFYDTDLSRLDHVDVVTGTKAWQLATRFAYAGLPVGRVEPELGPALARFLALPRPARGVKTMIVNYEQMMLIRKRLGFLDLEGGDR